jgi:hypothetical protein
MEIQWPKENGQKDKTLQNNHQIGQEIHTQSSKIVPSLLKGHSY